VVYRYSKSIRVLKNISNLGNASKDEVIEEEKDG
jgi:hypothetical protein